jgi:hypothetical protein
MADMAFDVLHLLGPAAFVHPECLKAAALRNGVKPGFGEKQNGAALLRLKPELTKVGGSLR